MEASLYSRYDSLWLEHSKHIRHLESGEERLRATIDMLVGLSASTRPLNRVFYNPM
ncbi:MAG: hypothetical protein JSV16_11645 [Candidatus Hydrogenedentota bacterium]|nr:MAG: hypothetical protein JSV16_11645 [Candidatus Hydrogenedentota bacterium]